MKSADAITINSGNNTDTQTLFGIAEDLSKLERYILQPPRTEALKAMHMIASVLLQNINTSLSFTVNNTHLEIRRSISISRTVE